MTFNKDEVAAVAAMMVKDQEEKKSILLKHLLPHCTMESTHPQLQDIGKALHHNASDALVCTVLSGGKTNYSYKIALRSAPSQPVLFAKVCFPYALWSGNRDKHYDTIRTQNEFDLMQQYSEVVGEGAPVAKPLLCLQGPDTIRILVTEWATNSSEQFANQFIDGHVDHRLFPKIAQSLADLHLKVHRDTSFNHTVKTYLLDFMAGFSTIFDTFLQSNKNDRCAQLGRQWGPHMFDDIVQGMKKPAEPENTTLIHNDTHVFNILVEEKPSLTSFGSLGTFVLCDWEMAIVGPMACDSGKFICLPVAAAIGHAAQGRMDCVEDILASLDIFWDTYLAALKVGGKSDAILRDTFKAAMGWSGYMIFLCVYSSELFTCMLGLDIATKPEAQRAVESSGIVALHMMRLGFTAYHSELNLEELRKEYHDLIMDESKKLSSLHLTRRTRGRRGSLLRISGRRISDASALDEVVHMVLTDAACQRESAYDVQLTPEMMTELETLDELSE
jgi:thiamine kinase-like enzyme